MRVRIVTNASWMSLYIIHVVFVHNSVAGTRVHRDYGLFVDFNLATIRALNNKLIHNTYVNNVVCMRVCVCV